MNERIKELAQSCWDRRLDQEKFADLIIQECLLALEPNPMASAIDYDVEEKFYKRSADKIQRHFGIKE
jgi:hypothetical protein